MNGTDKYISHTRGTTITDVESNECGPFSPEGSEGDTGAGGEINPYLFHGLTLRVPCSDDQAIRVVDLSKPDLNANTVKRISTKSELPIVDMTDKLK